MMPLETRSQDCQKITKACQDAVASANVVIKKQGELIEIMMNRNEELFKEKTQFEVMLDQTQSRLESQQKSTLWIGITAALLGSLATFLVIHQTK